MAQYQPTLAEISMRQRTHARNMDMLATWWRTENWWDKPLPYRFFWRTGISGGCTAVAVLVVAWLT